MLQSRRGVMLAVAATSLGLVLPATVGAADLAAATPAAGYTVAYVPTGQDVYAAAVDAATDTVYFGDYAADVVTVLDGSTNAVSATIPVGGAARGIAVDPSSDTMYVALDGSTPAVAVIDGATNTVADTIPLPAGSDPTAVAVDSSTDAVYVTEESTEAVTVIDGSTNSVTTSISTGTATLPCDLAIDATQDLVWVGTLGGSVLGISGATNSVTDTISLGGSAVESMAVNPVTGTAYAGTLSDGIAVIDEGTGTVSAYVAAAEADSLAVDPGSGTVFATVPGATWVIDDTTNAVTDTILRGGDQIAEDSSTGTAYEAPYTSQPDAAFVFTPSATNAMSPVIKSTTTTFSAGTDGSFDISGSALPAATYSETGALPSGVTLSSSGVLSGTLATGTGGAYPITLTASNSVPPDFSQPFTLYVDEAPTLAAPSAASFLVGTPGSVPIQVTGYPEPYVSATFLPTGISLTESSTGSWQLSGTPPLGTGGTLTTTLTATNTSGSATPVSMTITVKQPPSISSPTTATFGAGVAGSFAMAATGWPVPTFSETGALPAGVTLSTAGVLSGTPAAGTAGSYPIQVTATNSAGTTTQAFTLVVTAPSAVAVAVEGTNGAMYAQAPQLGAGWHSLAGHIVGPPAVVAPPNADGTSPVSPLFIATGTNQHLYIRSLTTGWREVGPVPASCLGSPAAVIIGTKLTVACEGTNHALYDDSATVTGSGLPQFTTGWTDLGGVLTAGPAVAPVGGTLTFFALGTTGEVYTRTLTTGFVEQPWACTGAPAAALQAATGQTVFACQFQGGGLMEVTNSGSGWAIGPDYLGGSLIGGPGIAATSQQIEFFGEGTNGAVFERTLSAGWTSIGGQAINGTGATALN
jgi:large repetitive protein